MRATTVLYHIYLFMNHYLPAIPASLTCRHPHFVITCQFPALQAPSFCHVMHALLFTDMHAPTHLIGSTEVLGM